MPISVTWDDDARTILRYTYSGSWTWTEYDVAIHQAYELSLQANAPLVDVIADFSDSRLLPQNALSGFQRSMNTSESIAFGITVLVGENMFLLRMIDLYRKLNHKTGSRIKTAKHLDEARAIIANIRAERRNIPDNSPL